METFANWASSLVKRVVKYWTAPQPDFVDEDDPGAPGYDGYYGYLGPEDDSAHKALPNGIHWFPA